MPGANKPPHIADTPARRLAFTRVFSEHGAYFYAYFCRHTGNTHTAEDLSQDFWLSVYRRFDTEKFGEIRLLQRRAKEVLADNFRRQRVRSFIDIGREYPEPVAAKGSEPRTDEEEMALQLRFWEKFPFVDLTPIQKTAFWMNEQQGYTLEEVSLRLSRPASTVHSWIERVKEQCRNSLKRETL